MPKKTTRKSRARGGFTFSEVLVTLAILGALLAVAIPATFALTKGLKMMELDACARQIAVAVQNNLTGMKSAGTLKSYGDKNTGTTGGHYISNGHADIQKILPIGAIDPAVADKYYTIVYNSATGTVLEVYYAEHSFTVSDALTNLSGMTSDKVED
ncbi:MAG: type II secretion system protein, partial [Oscillospiraceae bacterium]